MVERSVGDALYVALITPTIGSQSIVPIFLALPVPDWNIETAD